MRPLTHDRHLALLQLPALAFALCVFTGSSGCGSDDSDSKASSSQSAASGGTAPERRKRGDRR